jgi:hypothetical protein
MGEMRPQGEGAHFELHTGVEGARITYQRNDA